MHRMPSLRTSLILATSLSCSVGFAACGSDEATQQSADGVAESTAVVTEPPDATAPDAAAPDTAPPDGTIADTEPPPPETSIDDSWRDDAVTSCDRVAAGLAAIAPPASDDDVARFVQDHIALHDAAQANPVPEWPAALTEAPYDIDGLLAQQDTWIDLAIEQLAAGNVLGGSEFADNAGGSIDFYRGLARQIATVVAIGGAQCGPANPARAATAALNVPIFQAIHVNSGFDSVWVSNRGDNQVHRIDPGTGATQAVIDVGALPYRLQPADGRMVVRTADAYQFIDPATDAITGTLLKSNVGPAANRGWAVDGALWICDGMQLHRYDPTTLEPVTTIPLDFDCGNVYATGDLVIPWTYNEEPGESGTTVAALIDPATNGVRARIDMPVDVGVPVVADDIVFFPATEGSLSVVVDKAAGTITSTPDLGRPYVHSNDVGYDGTHLYVMVEGRDIAVVDPTTFGVVDTILPMDFDPPFGVQINALALTPGALWVVNDESSILQRFDLDEPGAE